MYMLRAEEKLLLPELYLLSTLILNVYVFPASRSIVHLPVLKCPASPTLTELQTTSTCRYFDASIDSRYLPLREM